MTKTDGSLPSCAPRPACLSFALSGDGTGLLEKAMNFGDSYRAPQRYDANGYTEQPPLSRYYRIECGCGAPVFDHAKPCYVCGRQVSDMSRNSFEWSTDRIRIEADSCEAQAAQATYYPSHVIEAWTRRAELLRQAQDVVIEVPQSQGAPY